ncbi:MAG: endolytic transglycosylase MltG [Oscillospiraceae bacterium]|nr:endolytic transglycosylase MltG [Oscillospiraceae bacterium]
MDNKQEYVQPDPQQTAEAQLPAADERMAQVCENLPAEEVAVPIAEEVVTSPDETVITEDTLAEEAEFLPIEDMSALFDDAAVDALIAELTEQPAMPVQTQDDLWENQAVDVPVLAEEIGVDEQAVAAAGLTHPEDLEFEKILAEAKLEDSFTEQEDTIQESEEEPEVTAQNSDADTEQDEPVEETEEAEATEEELEEDAEEEFDMQDLDNRTPGKRRPRKRSTYGFFGIPHILTTVVWLAIIVFIGVGLGKMVWNVAADMLAFGRPNQVITITITSDDDLDDIAQKLYDTGLIKYPGIFKFYGQLANAEKKIKAGTYELNAIYDYNALVKNMAGTADRVSTKVTIPEGYTCAQIFRLLERSGVCTVEALEEAAMSADLSNYWFLEGIDRSNPNCLEGYLFPDTYNFYLDYDATSVLKKLLSTFNKRFTESMVAKLDELNDTLASMMRSHGLPDSYIKNHLLTIQDVVIIASMIEKETAGDEESYYIASVIYNRLTNPGEFPFLNIDATIVYITGRSPVTLDDLKIDSPYNTYLYKGLIPGPISNPGLASLNAALSPENTEYYYYALDPSTGEHKFFKTYKAHQNFLESLKKG